MRPGIRAALTRVVALTLPAAVLYGVPAQASPTASPGGEAHRAAAFREPAPRAEQADLTGADRRVAQEHDVSPVVSSVTDPLPVRGVASAVGVSWSGKAPAGVLQWRFTSTSGETGEWAELPIEAHGPDAGSKEAEGARRASEPLLTTDPGSVELRLLGGRRGEAATVKATIDEVSAPSKAAPAGKGTTSARTTAAEQTALAGAPSIKTRADWGADESLRKSAPSYGAVKGEVVHHTVNANSYAANQVPSLIRAIYEYHVKNNGWNDIGYNFLIDRFGQTWEGRYGGTTKAVVGAHAPGVNSWTTSASTIGNFTSSGTAVPTAVTTAYKNLFAWKAQLHQLDPDWTVNLGGHTQRSISGHKDNTSTECPGAALYAKIPSITAATAAAVPNSPALTVRRDADNAGDNDVLVTTSDGRVSLVHAVDGQLSLPEASGIVAEGLDMVRVAGDWNGDGAVDVIARVKSTGALHLYAGDGTGGFRGPVQIGKGWNTMRIMTSVGDVTGDRVPDLIAATSIDSELRVYPGDGKGSFLRPKVIGYRWNGIRSLVGIGDWNRDGRPDVLGIMKTGEPIVYNNAGGGVLGNGPRLNFVAPEGATVSAIGDVTGDSGVDLVVRDAVGTVRVAASTANVAVIRWIDQSPETISTWRDVEPHEG
ncbi:hypothetical protein GCM10022415_03480 [Knoellia locipacati]|uniref:Peptidoglycan recognition protein family domain-containing protein n=1 Tax=Knoellia locipacati TaxID=882824 RepID=A0A512SWG9_9MICO|nr:FG-GAP-like repeat-containing protein [Knoellia locipacati]GEQ12300.1 hypothetical protein KLO01_03470 [Knoellia locipacati]